jgi:Ca2+/Na+ antiporter
MFILGCLFYILAWITENYFCTILGKIASSFKVVHFPCSNSFFFFLDTSRYCRCDSFSSWFVQKLIFLTKIKGNGAPDVFTTITAIQQDNFGVAIGELVGAGVFITTAIVGSVALVSVAELK